MVSLKTEYDKKKIVSNTQNLYGKNKGKVGTKT